MIEPGFIFNRLNIFFADIDGIFPEFFKLGFSKSMVRAVFQLDIKFQIVHQTGPGQIAGTRNNASRVPVAVFEAYDIEFGVDVLRGISANFQFFAADPFQKFGNAFFHQTAVRGIFHFIFQQAFNFFLCLCMGELKRLLLLLCGCIQQIVRLFIRADTNEDSDFFSVFKSRINGIKAAGIKITDETIKQLCIFNQDIKSVFKMLSFFVRDEGQVSGHFYLWWTVLIGRHLTTISIHCKGKVGFLLAP